VIHRKQLRGSETEANLFMENYLVKNQQNIELYSVFTFLDSAIFQQMEHHAELRYFFNNVLLDFRTIPLSAVLLIASLQYHQLLELR
jgi:hypothetical protein